MALINWVFQEELLDGDAFEGLWRAARFLGHGTEAISRGAIEHVEAPFPKGSCVITMGSHLFLTEFNFRFRTYYHPWFFGRLENFRYPVYADHLNELIFYNEYKILPLREVADHFSELVFIRPIETNKSFDGHITTIEGVMLLNRMYSVPLDELVICAHPKKFRRSFRFVIADRDIVACSAFSRAVAPDEYVCAREVAKAVASLDWQPDIVFCCDVVTYRPSYMLESKVLELNPFSSADLFFTDSVALAHAVGQAAWKGHVGGDAALP